jgi:hypothetical protein
VDIPDFILITDSSWGPGSESVVLEKIAEGCGELGATCVDYTVVVELNPEYQATNDCPVLDIDIPRPLYDVDIAATPHRDDLITIVINDPCDGVIVSAPASPASD